MKSEMQFPYALLNKPDLVSIETQAAQILDGIGVELQGDAKSLDAMASVGARVEGQRVRIDADLLRDLIARAPASFVWQGGGVKRLPLGSAVIAR